MKKIIIAVALAGLLAAGCNSAQSNSDTKPSPASSSSSTSSAAPEVNSAEISMADIQAANSATKCWTAVDGVAYDLTGFMKVHPGGMQAILKWMCGKDGTAAFKAQHGSQSRPQKELAKYKIGIVKQPVNL